MKISWSNVEGVSEKITEEISYRNSKMNPWKDLRKIHLKNFGRIKTNSRRKPGKNQRKDFARYIDKNSWKNPSEIPKEISKLLTPEKILEEINEGISEEIVKESWEESSRESLNEFRREESPTETWNKTIKKWCREFLMPSRE